MFPNYYDPCPLYGLEEGKDGLADEDTWIFADYDGVFINPPYSAPRAWVEKAISVNKKMLNCEKENVENWSRYDSIEDIDCDCINCREWDLSGDNIVLLLKHDSSTEAYRLLHEAGAYFILINRRLKYQTNRPAAFPSMLAVLSVC